MKIEKANGEFIFVTVKSKEGKAELARRSAEKEARAKAKEAAKSKK